MVLSRSDSDLDHGDPAPEFALPGADGESYTLDEFADRDALLVVFTCNHCPYARAKIEPLNAIAAEYDEVAVVGINPNDAEEYPEDSFERMEELVSEGTIAYDAYLRDETGEVAEAYGAVCTPDPFLFRREEGEGSRSPEGSSDARFEAQRGPREANGEKRPVSDRSPRGGEFRLVYHGRIDDAHDPDEEPTEHTLREVIEAVLAGEEVTVEELPSRGCSIKWREE